MMMSFGQSLEECDFKLYKQFYGCLMHILEGKRYIILCVKMISFAWMTSSLHHMSTLFPEGGMGLVIFANIHIPIIFQQVTPVFVKWCSDFRVLRFYEGQCKQGLEGLLSSSKLIWRQVAVMDK